MKRCFLLSLVLLFFPLCAPASTYLFVLYDAGETHALAPVIRKMEGHDDYRVLVMATARFEVAKLGIPREKVVDLNADLGVLTLVDNQSWPRDAKLPSAELENLRDLDATVVVTGVASTLQWQIADWFRRSGSRIVSYYDNLYFPLEKHPYSEIIKPFEAISDLILVPASPLAASFQQTTVAVVGQPSLEVWHERVAALDVRELRKKLDLEPDDRLLVYCGGYGGDYPQAFRLFAESLQGVQGYRVMVQLHPKVDGAFEKSILKEYALDGVLCKKGMLSTIEAVAAADLVVCHQSTVGIQALFAGKKVLYVNLPSSDFSTFATELGLAKQVTNPTAFLEAIDEMAFLPTLTLEDLYQRAGIPQHSATLIYNLLRDLPK